MTKTIVSIVLAATVLAAAGAAVAAPGKLTATKFFNEQALTGN
jgi:hypothetical protein